MKHHPLNRKMLTHVPNQEDGCNLPMAAVIHSLYTRYQLLPCHNILRQDSSMSLVSLYVLVLMKS